MTFPDWKVSSDPEYLRVRGLILKFLTLASGRPYRDGRLTEDQKDDIQDAFERYLTKIVGKAPKDGRELALLRVHAKKVLDLRREKSIIKVGEEYVPREHITTRNS